MTIQVLGTFLTLIEIIIFILLTLFSVIEKDKDTKEMEPSKDDQPQSSEIQKDSVVKIQTTGKHLNDLYLYSVYIISFSVLAIFLMLSFFGLDNISFGDIWPFIFFVVILIISSLLIIGRAKVKSKRTIQRDMREI